MDASGPYAHQDAGLLPLFIQNVLQEALCPSVMFSSNFSCSLGVKGDLKH